MVRWRLFTFLLHCQITVLSCLRCLSSGKGKPFRFLNCLANHESFIQLVTEAWQSEGSGNPMTRVWFRLKKVKERLKTLNTQHYSNVSQRLQVAQDKLQQVQFGSLCLGESCNARSG